MEFSIQKDNSPNTEDTSALFNGLDAFNEAIIGPDKRKDLTFFVRDSNEKVVGGIQGSCGSYGWLWIGTLWVAENVRGTGMGSKLLSEIENEAKRLGCKYAYLNSFSFGPVEFYKKSGYEIYAELEDFPNEHSVYSLRKKLTI